jgi:long-chain fatty acid transport protein
MFHFRLALLIGATLLLSATTVFAGGAYLSEIGTPASVGTAGAGNVTNTFSADAAWTNPAGMADLEGDQALVGFQVLIPTVRFDSDIAESGGSDGGNAGFVSAIPSTFVTREVAEDWRLGLAVVAPLGGGADFGKDFVGRYQATRSVLMGLSISPALSYKVNEKLSLGAGLSFVNTVLDLDISINQKTPLNPTAPDGRVNIDKIDDWGYQGYLGVIWKPTDRLTIGGVYRSELDTKLEGDLSVKNIIIPPINRLASTLDEVKVDFDFPQVIQLGLKYKLTENLLLLADFDWEDWSAFGETGVQIQGGPAPIVTSFDRKWKDTYHVGLGLIHKDGPHVVSGGIGYDSSPVDDEDRTVDLPADEQFRIGFAYGNEWKGNLNYALGASYVWLGDGKIDQVAGGERFKGDFSTNQIIFLSATLNYRF